MWSILVGIDDTDNKESRGTGYLCRRLAALMHNSELGEVSNVSRHQHFIHPDIPYTSQNSSACLTVHTGNPAGLAELCRDFVCRESAEGSDAGLSIAAYENISEENETTSSQKTDKNEHNEHKKSSDESQTSLFDD